MGPTCNVLFYCTQKELLPAILTKIESCGVVRIDKTLSHIDDLKQALVDTEGVDALLVAMPTDKLTEEVFDIQILHMARLPIVGVDAMARSEASDTQTKWLDACLLIDEIKWLPYQVDYLKTHREVGRKQLPKKEIIASDSVGDLRCDALIQALFEATSDALLVLDNNSQVVGYNQKFMRMWQFSDDFFASLPNAELEVLFRLHLAVPKSFITPQAPDYIDPDLVSSDVLQFVDGRKYEVFSQAQVVEGQMVGRVWSFRDITLRKKIEKELNESTSKLKTIVNNLQGVVFSCLAQGNFPMQFISQGIEELSGYPVSGFSNQKERGFLSIVHPDDTAAILYVIERTHLNTQPLSLEFRIVCADGALKWVWFRGSVVPDGQYNRLLEGFMSDITDRKKAQTQLELAKSKSEESDKLKTAFLHNISHEIRTPINAILGFSRLLEDDSLPPEKRRRFNQVILSSANNLIAIIDDIVDMAAIEAQQVTLKAEPVDVADLLRTLYVQYAPKAKDKGLAIRCLIEPSLEGVKYMVDQTKLTQVFTNLLNNAFKFTGHGSIMFGVEKDGTGLRFFVKDTGIGIPADMQSRIFERFHQIEHRAKQNTGGMGLGLAICKAYIELMGSVISVNSQLGAGAEFFFSLHLPKTAQPEEQVVANETNGASRGGSGNLILIAEDEQTNFMLLSEMLNVLKMSYIRASNGREAVEMCRDNPNLKMVLMDIKMPVLDGLDATRQIREFAPMLPIVAVTAYTYSHGKKQVLEAGCTDYITKPISFNGLKALVTRYMYH